MFGFTPSAGNREDCGPHQRLSQTTATARNYDVSSGELRTLCGFCINGRKQSAHFEGKMHVCLLLNAFHLKYLKNVPVSRARCIISDEGMFRDKNPKDMRKNLNDRNPPAL